MTNTTQILAAFNRLVLPLFVEQGFEGTFPSIVRQRSRESDFIHLQCDRNGGGFVCIIKCYDASFQRASAIKPNRVEKVPPVRGITVTQCLAGMGDGYWFSCPAGQEDHAADEWLPVAHGILAWCEDPSQSGVFNGSVVPEGRLSLLGRLVRTLRTK